MLRPEIARYASLPGGHQEGWPDALYNVMTDIYGVIDGSPASPTFCTFAGATRTACVIDAMLKSAAEGGVWQAVAETGVQV
jgi:hypothetical protein